VTPVWRGQEPAEVAGSQFAPYDVRVVFDEAGIIEARALPLRLGGRASVQTYRRHLLACAHLESVRELPALEEVLWAEKED